jgi:hypothetical protein
VFGGSVAACKAHCDAMAPCCTGFVVHEDSHKTCWLKSNMADKTAVNANRDGYVAVQMEKTGKRTVERHAPH